MSTLDVDTVTRVAEEKPEVLKKLTVRDKDIDFIDDLRSGQNNCTLDWHEPKRRSLWVTQPATGR